jgi:hypothetical protein
MRAINRIYPEQFLKRVEHGEMKLEVDFPYQFTVMPIPGVAR